MLYRLNAAGLTLNLKKSEFFPKQIRYLGHIIGEGSMFPNIQKVQGIEDPKTPSTLKGIRSIHGLFSYYREYIPNFAEIAEPITRLLKKGTEVRWEKAQEEALKKLKTLLEAAILAIPLETDEFILETDASGYAIGAILSIRKGEKNLPVECASATLTGTQRRWPTREKEAWAIIWALRKFDSYLRGRTFDVYTDHHSLQWLFTAKNGKLARWAQTIQEYDVKVHYKSGPNMEHVDIFSRNPEDDDFLEDRMAYSIEEIGSGPFDLEKVRQETHREFRGLPQSGYQYQHGL